jgi:hypothetical protein
MKCTLITFILLSSTFTKTADPNRHLWKSNSHSQLPNATDVITQENQPSLVRTQSRVTLGDRRGRGHRRTHSKSFTEGTAPQVVASMKKSAENALTLSRPKSPDWLKDLKSLPHVHATAQMHHHEMVEKELQTLSTVAKVVQTEESLQKTKILLSFSNEITDQLLSIIGDPEKRELLTQHERNPDLKRVTSILDQNPEKCAALLKILQTFSTEHLTYLADHAHLSADTKDVDPAMQHKCLELMQQLYQSDVKPLQEAHEEAKQMTRETQELVHGLVGYAQAVETAETTKWLDQMPHLMKKLSDLQQESTETKEEAHEAKNELCGLLQQIMQLQEQQKQIFEWHKNQVEGRATVELQIQMIAQNIQAHFEHEEETRDAESSSSNKRKNSRGSKTRHFLSGPLSPRSSKDRVERSHK